MALSLILCPDSDRPSMKDPPESAPDMEVSATVAGPLPPPLPRIVALPSPKRAGAMLSPSSCLEIRLFYVRISPCAACAAPSRLTLSHLRCAVLDINGRRVPASPGPASVPLHCSRLDRGASDATYVSTDVVRLSGAAEFEVCDDRGVLLLCGSLERMELPWSNGGAAPGPDRDQKTGWGLNCYVAASVGSSAFVQQSRMGASSPSVEVYVAGCCAGHALILMHTLQISPRRKATRPLMLDAIPEDEDQLRNNHGSLVQHHKTPLSASEEDIGEPDSELKIGHDYYPDGWYPDEDGEFTWFNAGVRVGVGIGLGVCVGVGIGVGLFMRSYQAAARNFRRRFL